MQVTCGVCFKANQDNGDWEAEKERKIGIMKHERILANNPCGC